MASTLRESMQDPVRADARQPLIVVDDVSMVFNIANEQLNSLKEYFIALLRGKLFFKEFKALDGITFSVNRGDVYGIVGTNGSGKSTLLKIISGVLQPTHGSCEVYGSIAPLIELGAGFDLDLTARENVYLNGSLLGYSKKFIDEHFDEIVDFAEVREFIDMPLKNYSSGMVARIAFAIATATTPDVLVVDEALSVGDFIFQEKCERRINDLVEHHGTTLLFVSHSIDQVERVCKQALWIEKGYKRMEGSVEDVCFAYRNMEYTDFVEDNGILTLKRSSAADLKKAVTIDAILLALWRSVGSPSAGQERDVIDETSEAMAWGASKGIVGKRQANEANREATRLELARIIRAFSSWRKPSVDAYNPVDVSSFADSMPEDERDRVAVEWCVSHKLITAEKRADGSMELALGEPASYVALARAISRLFRNVYSYHSDVRPSDWFVLPGYYDYVTEHDLIGGYDSGMFGPDDSVTRAQALTIIWRAAGKPASAAATPFEDVPAEAFSAPAVAWALENGLIEAGQADFFRPDDPITVEELARLAFRYVSGKLGASEDESTDPLIWCRENGLLDIARSTEGVESRNASQVTRAEMTKLVAIVQRDML